MMLPTVPIILAWHVSQSLISFHYPSFLRGCGVCIRCPLSFLPCLDLCNTGSLSYCVHIIRFHLRQLTPLPVRKNIDHQVWVYMYKKSFTSPTSLHPAYPLKGRVDLCPETPAALTGIRRYKKLENIIN